MTDVLKIDLMTKPTLKLGGGLTAALADAGLEVSTPTLSVRTALDHPQALMDAHTRYFEAGADVAMTHTALATMSGLKAMGLSQDEAATLIQNAVLAAVHARNNFYNNLAPNTTPRRAPQPLVAGTVAPLNTDPTVPLTPDVLEERHLMQMVLMATAGVDLFAFAGIGYLVEAQALTAILKRDFPKVGAWMTLALKDADHLIDGTPLADAIDVLSDSTQLEAIGVTGLADATLLTAIQTIRQTTDRPIVVTANNDPAGTTIGDAVIDWIDAGANLVGGAEQTQPGDIAAMVTTMQTHHR